MGHSLPSRGTRRKMVFPFNDKVVCTLVASTAIEKVSKNLSKTRKKPGAKVRIDWQAVKAAYVEGLPREGTEKNREEREWLTLNEVAAKFGVYPATVRKHAGEERWGEQRAAYQARLADTRRRRRSILLSKEAVDFDGRALSSAKLGMTMVQTRLGEVARDVQAQNARRLEAERRIAAGLTIDPEDFASVIDARELQVLANAAQAYQQLAKVALGEDVIRHEHSGVDGGAIEVDVEAEVTHSIKDEMNRAEDPDRLAALMDVMERANLLQEDIIDGEIEEEDED